MLDLGLVNTWRVTNGFTAISESQIDTNEYNSFDMRVSKSIKLGGVRKVELVAQMFNMLGHDNLLPPASSAGWVENALSGLVRTNSEGEQPPAGGAGDPSRLVMSGEGGAYATASSRRALANRILSRSAGDMASFDTISRGRS